MARCSPIVESMIPTFDPLMRAMLVTDAVTHEHDLRGALGVPGDRDSDAIPNDAAVLRLVSAVVAETHDEWQDSERRYLAEHTMNLLYEPDIDEPLDTKEVMAARLAS